MVLLHAPPFWPYEWHRFAPHLARGRSVRFHDMLGYGRSAKPEADVSLGVQNGLVGALRAEWGASGRTQWRTLAAALRAHLIDGLEFRLLTLIDPVALAPWRSPVAFRGVVR